MRLITTIAFALLGITTWAQTSLPDLPAGALRYSQTLWIVPSDSTLWTGLSGNYAQVATREQLRQLASQGYTKSQVDSAIVANAPDLTAFYTKLQTDALLNDKADVSDLVGVLKVGDNVSDLVNDVPYLTSGDIPSPPVTSVNSMTGAVVVSKADIGLGNVDNTSDLDKPISTDTQGALDGKENAFSKGSLVAGTGVTLSGTLANRLVGSGNVTINSVGAQSLSVSDPGGISISGGNTVQLTSLYRLDKSDASILYTQGGLRSFLVSTGATGYPFSLGGGITFQRHVNNNGLFEFSKSTDNDENLYVRFGTGASTFSPFYSIATKEWATANFSNVVFTRTNNGLVPSPGGSGTTRFLREDGTWAVPDGGGGGGTATDLSIQNRTSTNLQIGSSTGTNATVPAATTTLAGLISAADKTKLNGLVSYSGGDGINVSGSTLSVDEPYLMDLFVGKDPTNPSTSIGVVSDLSNQLGFGVFQVNTNTMDSPIPGANGVVLNMASASNNSPQMLFGGSASGFNVAPFYRNRQSSVWESFWTTQNFNPSNYLEVSNFNWINLSGKPSTFSPSPHTHNASDINSGTLSLARIPTGTTGSTVALGNDSRINNGQTAYGWGDYRQWGLGAVNTLPTTAEFDNLGANNQFISAIDGTSSPFTQLGAGIHVALNGSRMAQLWFNVGIQTMQYRTNFSGWNDVHTVWSTQNLANPATSGTAGSQVRTNTQLDARYIQSITAGSGISVSGTTVSVDGTVVRTTGNQTIAGTKTFSSPVVAPQYQGTSTTASSSIPTNTQSLFKATISSNTNYTLTNLSGNPRQIQVMVTNTSGSTVYVNFSGGSVRMADGATDNVPASATVIFTFLIENGSAWGVKSTFL